MLVSGARAAIDCDDSCRRRVLSSRALWDFDTSEPAELTFHAGDWIQITRKLNDDWWEGTLLMGEGGGARRGRS